MKTESRANKYYKMVLLHTYKLSTQQAYLIVVANTKTDVLHAPLVGDIWEYYKSYTVKSVRFDALLSLGLHVNIGYIDWIEEYQNNDAAKQAIRISVGKKVNIVNLCNIIDELYSAQPVTRVDRISGRVSS